MCAVKMLFPMQPMWAPILQLDLLWQTLVSAHDPIGAAHIDPIAGLRPALGSIPEGDVYFLAFHHIGSWAPSCIVLHLDNVSRPAGSVDCLVVRLRRLNSQHSKGEGSAKQNSAVRDFVKAVSL